MPRFYKNSQKPSKYCEAGTGYNFHRLILEIVKIIRFLKFEYNGIASVG